MSRTLTTDAPRCSIAISLLVGAAIAVPVAAQEPPRPAWMNEFDEVEVKVINPDDLPKAEESRLPSALGRTSALPRATSLETLRNTSAQVSDRVIEVLVVPRDDSPVRQTQIVVRGEAVWLSAKPSGAEPVLVTNAHYLVNASAIFVKPPPPRRAAGLPTAQRRSVKEMSLGADVKALLADPALIPVEIEHLDKHRNLATLRAAPERLPVPARGLEFFPIDDEATSAAYGFSHQLGSTLVLTLFLSPSGKREELDFYLHTTFPVILGAPIMAADGRVIAMTASRHPNEPERTLAIPPRALQKFVARVQGMSVAADNNP